MFKCVVARMFLFILVSLILGGSVFAQCGPPYPPCSTPTPEPSPTPTASPAPTPSPTAPTSAPSPTVPPGPSTPTGATVTSGTSSIPGYTSNGNYGPGRTAAYIIAPFAIVAGAYVLGHHQIEIHPNAGFFWPGGNDNGQLRNEGMYGLKASASITDTVGVEGNFSYINHFESKIAPTSLDQSFGISPRTVHGLIYDVNGVFNFGRRPIFGSRVSPYITAGIGGLSTLIERGNAAVIGGQFYSTDSTGTLVLDSGRKVVVADHTPFFSVNYGGGVKANNLWGPLGVRADVRGRTFPNFRGDMLTWPEVTAGFTVSYGKR